MDTTRLPPDFKEFLQLLSETTVEYLLIGGYAVGYYGYVRATADMDIWIALNPENATKVADAVRRFGFDAPELSPALFLKDQNVIRMGVPPFRIELLTSISGVQFDECFADRTEDTIDGVPVSIISLAHLKANKLASGRAKDQVDVKHLP